MAGPVLVCGGRDYADRDMVFATLDKLARRVEILAIRHGAARGADSLAGEWARARGIPEEPFPADWAAHGKGDGARRNAAMLAAHDPAVPTSRVVCVVAFPGGVGTADMVSRAKAAGVPVWGIRSASPYPGRARA